MESDIKNINDKLAKLVVDVEIIKGMLAKKDPEGELTDWAKKQLKIAREAPASEYVSHEEVKRRILAKK